MKIIEIYSSLWTEQFIGNFVEIMESELMQRGMGQESDLGKLRRSGEAILKVARAHHWDAPYIEIGKIMKNLEIPGTDKEWAIAKAMVRTNLDLHLENQDETWRDIWTEKTYQMYDYLWECEKSDSELKPIPTMNQTKVGKDPTEAECLPGPRTTRQTSKLRDGEQGKQVKAKWRVTLRGEFKRVYNERHVKDIMVKPSLVRVAHGEFYTAKEDLKISKHMESEQREKWTRMQEDPAMGHLFKVKTTTAQTVKKSNDYKARMLRQLAKYAREGEQEKFDRLAYVLAKESKVFRQAMILAVEPKIWKYDLQKRMRIDGNMHLVWKYYIPTFNYKRLDIKKPDGTTRPLAIPMIESRIAGKWLLWMAEIWLDGRKRAGKRVYADHQTGCIEERGCPKAWQKIFKDIIPKPWIMEFDIAKCFDQIDWLQIYRVLKEVEIPRNLLDMIMGTIIVAADQLPHSKWLDEEEKRINSKSEANLTAERPYKTTIEHWKDVIMEKVRGIARAEQSKVDNQKINAITATNILANWEDFGGASLELKQALAAKLEYDIPINQWEYMPKAMTPKEASQWPFIISTKRTTLEDMKGWREPSDPMVILNEKWFKEEKEKGYKAKGIPQGWALSPMITNLILRDMIDKGATAVTYLDDGIIAGDSLADINIAHTINNLQEKGLNLAGKKVHWIRQNGKWLRDIKFLGMAWSHQEGWMSVPRNQPPTRIPEATDTSGNAIPNGTLQRACNHIQHMNQLMAYGYNGGGAYIGKRWVAMSDDYLWYRVFQVSKMTQEIKKHHLECRALHGQWEAQKLYSARDALETMNMQQMERIKKEYTEIGDDGVRRLKGIERANMYEQTYWNEWITKLEDKMENPDQIMENLRELRVNPYLDKELNLLIDRNKEREATIEKLKAKLRGSA